MGKKLTITQIKKELSKLPNEELIDIICRLCKSSKEAASLVNLILGNDSILDDALAEAKKKIRNQFFTKRGFGRLNLNAAKSEITAFKRICKVPAKLIDLQLYYVECGIEFTNMLGDINESFYNSMSGMYETAVNSLINTEDLKLIEEFMPRLKQAVDDTDGIGWGFHDDLYYTFSGLDDFRDDLTSYIADKGIRREAPAE